MAQGVIAVDGSQGEGGGQILRTAVALSAITGKACRIENIRAGRPNPGLAASHATALRAAAAACSASLTGVEVGSPDIEFRPGTITAGKYVFDVGTAGALTLVLQTLVPIALRAPAESTFQLRGGTDVPWSPPMDYFEHILCWWLRLMGAEVRLVTRRRGFYPKGGGLVDVIVQPAGRLRPLPQLIVSPLGDVHVESLASRSLRNSHVAERQVEGFRREFGGDVDHRIEYLDTYSFGSILHAHAHTGDTKLGANALGKRGLPAEDVGAEAARELRKELDAAATLDIHMSDQILLYAALASGPSTFTAREVSGHTATAMALIPEFVPCRFVTEPLDKGVRVTVTPG